MSAQASHTFAAEGIGRYNYRYTENVQVPRSEIDEWMTSDLGQWPQLLLLLLKMMMFGDIMSVVKGFSSIGGLAL